MISGAIPGPGIILELLLDLAPYLFLILIGFYAERIFKTRLYGRVVDIVISLIGGLGLATVPLMIWSVYYNKLAENFYADLVKRGVDTTGQHPTTWFTESVRNVFCSLAAILGALILLYIVRLFAGRRVQNLSGVAPAPTFAMAPSVTMAPPASPAPARSDAGGSAIMDQLKKLGELHAAGILTDSEFASKKADLLSRL